MNSRTYFKILGITPTKDEKVIRKAYHKKALKFHPDRNKNPNAEGQFIRVNEAYENLLIAIEQSKKSKTKHPYSTQERTQKRAQQRPNECTQKKQSDKEKQEEYDEKMRKARARYEYMKRKEAEENERYYHSITTGKKWRFYKTILVACSIVATLLFADYYLPTHTDKVKIKSMNLKMAYSGLIEESISPVQLESGEKLWLNFDLLSKNYNKSSVYAARTYFFNDIESISVWTAKGWKKSGADYSLYSTFPLVPFTLFIPLLTFVVRGRTVTFSFLFNLSIYALPIILAFVLISNDRLLHFITLGWY